MDKTQNDSKRERIHEEKIRDRLKWKEQCDICKKGSSAELAV